MNSLSYVFGLTFNQAQHCLRETIQFFLLILRQFALGSSSSEKKIRMILEGNNKNNTQRKISNTKIMPKNQSRVFARAVHLNQRFACDDKVSVQVYMQRTFCHMHIITDFLACIYFHVNEKKNATPGCRTSKPPNHALAIG